MPTIPARLRLRAASSLWTAALVSLALAPGMVAVGPGAVRAAGPVPVPASVTFQGRGYGHGVGMNQYGARGRALDGQKAGEILAHYYQGTTIGTIDTATPIRVLVLSDFHATPTKPVVLHARGSEWKMTGTSLVFPPNAKVTVTPTVSTTDGTTTTTWRVVVTSASGSQLYAGATTGIRMMPQTIDGRTQVDSRSSDKDEYRGVTRVRLSTVVQVINETTVETYLRGVVPAEMPSTWPTEALKAQALAARSFAAAHLRPGVSYFDLKDDTSAQIYLGAEGEKAMTNAAIATTAGKVVMSGTKVANTLFHSTGGGATENNENVFVSSTGQKVAGVVSYLRGSMDRRDDGTAYDEAAPYATWSMKSYTRAQLSGWFAADSRTNVGTLQSWDLSRRGVSGRLISVTLVGSKGSKTVSGDVFRSVINAGRQASDPMMRSTLLDTKPIP